MVSFTRVILLVQNKANVTAGTKVVPELSAWGGNISEVLLLKVTSAVEHMNSLAVSYKMALYCICSK